MSLGRFTPLGWTQGLLAILAGLIASFFLFGFFSPYWRVADQDILLIFDAFLQNDGLPRQVDFHPVHLIADLAAVGFDVAEGGLVALAGGVLGYFLEADGFEKRSELR